jgi:hypothetical protein
MNALSELHDQDYSAWAKQMAELLKSRRFDQLDIEHLVEELEDMGKSEQRELENRLRVLLSHLLKWQFQYQKLSDRWKEFDGKSWRATITQQRAEIQFLLERYPGVRQFFEPSLKDVYDYARRLAHKETRLPLQTFPESCPYSREQILDEDFYPAAE